MDGFIGTMLYHITRHVHILEMNDDSMATSHEEMSELGESKFSFAPGSPGEGIEHLTETAGIGNQ